MKAKQQQKKNQTATLQKPKLVSGFEVILIALVFILYGNTLFNEYALDDSMVITNNAFTKKGFSGIGDILVNDSFLGFSKEMLGESDMKNFVQGGRYRPLSLVSFAVEYAIFKEKPGISHFFNLIFYALTAVLVYRLLLKLLKESFSVNFIENTAFVAALLFLVHPLHTEVVANIKGRDELLAFLFSILAWIKSVNYSENKNKNELLKATIYFFLALLSKESAIAFLFVIPFSIYLFKQQTIKKDLILYLSLAGVALLFIAIRQIIVLPPAESTVGGLMNNPFENVSFVDRVATAFYTFTKYYGLLFFPHPLTYDYYPNHITVQTFNSFTVIVGVLITLILLVLSMVLLKKNKAIAFSLLYFFATFFLLSNIPINIGAFMGERFLYMPSLGFCLIIAYLLTGEFARIKLTQIVKPVLILVCVVFGVKTIARNLDWKNNKSLFEADSKTSFNSAHVNKNLGETYMQEAGKASDADVKKTTYNSAIRYLKKSVGVYPDYYDAWVSIGNSYYYQAKYDSSIVAYYISIKLNPEKSVRLYRAIADVYGLNLGNYRLSILYMEKALVHEPSSVQLLTNISIAYYRLKEFDKAIAYAKKVLQIEPSNAEAKTNLDVFTTEYNNQQKIKS